MNIAIYTLGCKLNQAESNELKFQLTELGYKIVNFKSTEKISVIRACGVTNDATRRTRQIIHQAKKLNKITILTGCAEKQLHIEADYYFQTNQNIIDFIKKTYPLNKPIKQKKLILEKTRAFVRIQTGCNFRCSYCLIPHFRGNSISRAKELIIKEIKNYEKNNIQEIVLTGVNICQYQNNGFKLSDLLNFILKHTEIPRIRLGSLDPRLITDDLIEIYKNNSNRLLPHWHLSLQSGSNKILKLMNRFYSQDDYLDIIKKLRTFNPIFSFTTDIIVGFPQETEKDFQQTINLIQKIIFTKIHIFPFSARPQTLAEKLTGQIDIKTKKQRLKQLSLICQQTQKQYLKSLINKQRPVLFEQQKNGYWYGYTPEYVKIKFKSSKNLQNKIINIKLNKENIKPPTN